MFTRIISAIKPILGCLAPYIERGIAWMGGNMAEKDGTPSSMRLISVPLSYLLVITFVIVFMVASYHIGGIYAIPYETSFGFASLLGVLLWGKIAQKGKE